jgi:hypothetical protein
MTKPRKRKQKYDEGRFSLCRLVVPSSKETLDIQLLVDEARKTFESNGERFFVGKFLAGLVREGVKSLAKQNPRIATYIMNMMTFPLNDPKPFYLRRYESLRLMEDNIPLDGPSTIPSIFSYYHRKIGTGHKLQNAFRIGMISDEDVFLAYVGAKEIVEEVDSSLILKDCVTMNSYMVYPKPESTKKRKKPESRLVRPIPIRKMLESPQLIKYLTKEEIKEYQEMLQKADNPGEREDGLELD